MMSVELGVKTAIQELRDVQSHMYSLSFAPKTDWSKRYAEAPEIFDYIQDITNQYQIKTTVSLTMRLLMYSMMKCAIYGH